MDKAFPHRRRTTLAASIAALLLLPAAPLPAQLLDEPLQSQDSVDAEEPRYGEPVIQLFRVGAIVTAKRGACRDILTMVAVPIECEEQTVSLIEEDFTPNIGQVKFRDLAGGEARQMVVSIPYLESGAEARAVLTYEVRTRTQSPPSEQASERLTIPRRVPSKLKRFTSPSPFIEARHPKVKKLARSVLAEIEEDAEQAASDWLKVESLYDYVLDNIEYLEGPDTSALTTLRDGSADCHGRSALFVALCRSIGVPARMVWVQDHCYPEFYLEDEEGQGQWLPAESAGTRAFGEMPLARTIMQKGDNFRVPERPRDRLRYATDFLTGVPVPGSGKPSVKYLRETVD